MRTFVKSPLRSLTFGLILWAGSGLAQAQDATVAEETSSKADALLEMVTPDKVFASTAGYQGALGLGLRYEFGHVYALDMSYGYTPEQIGGTTIQQFNLINRFNLIGSLRGLRRSFGAYANVGLMYGMDRDLFLVLPERYPRNYYAPTAVRYLIGMGVEAYIRPGFDVYVEYNVHDSEAMGYINSHYDGAEQDMGTLGLGVRYRL